MKKSILITGVAGSGKSTICKELKRKKYKAYDIENMKGLFKMVDEKTGKTFRKYDDDDFEKVKRAKWMCNAKKLKDLIKRKNKTPVFCCGIASNIDEILPFFDMTILLRASPRVLRERLSHRRRGNFGRTKEVQEWMLSWKGWIEKEKKKKGAIVINANRRPKEVAKKIIKITSAKN